MKTFELGDTVVFDPTTFDRDYWCRLSMEDKKKYYGDLFDFDHNKPILFTFLCHHKPQHGHCMLVNMYTGKVEVMRHTNNFRKAMEDEC